MLRPLVAKEGGLEDEFEGSLQQPTAVQARHRQVRAKRAGQRVGEACVHHDGFSLGKNGRRCQGETGPADGAGWADAAPLALSASWIAPLWIRVGLREIIFANL